MNKACENEPFNRAVELINDLTAYQLYRLQAHIEVLLEEPTRLKPVARTIVPKCEIEYFCRRENRCVPAIVDKVNRTTVDVTNVQDGGKWRIELAAVNTGSTEVYAQPRSSSRQLSRHDLSVGQIVGFQDRGHQDRFGTIVRLNQKTVTLECEFGTKWRVGYSLLFFVLDGQPCNHHSSDDSSRQQLLLD